MNSIVTDHRLAWPKVLATPAAGPVCGWLVLACVAFGSLPGVAWADQGMADVAEPVSASTPASTPAFTPAAAPDHPYKLSFGLYPMRGGGQAASTGADLNLRYGYGSGNVWLGRYQADGQGTQWRGGWDRSLPLPGGWRLQPSLQLASGGFAGGSLGLERGSKTDHAAISAVGVENLPTLLRFAGLGQDRAAAKPRLKPVDAASGQDEAVTHAAFLRLSARMPCAWASRSSASAW